MRVPHVPLLVVLTLLGALQAHGARGPLFLVNDSHVPSVAIAWPTSDGQRVRLEGDRPWGSKNDRTPLGHNLECFVAAGGTRLDKGAGHPDGAVVRVGFYKQDVSNLLFEDLAPGGVVEIELRNVAFSEKGVARPSTVLQHLQYIQDDVVSCGLGREGLDLYNTRDPDETLKGKIGEINTRFGALAGDVERGQGEVELIAEPDGTLTMRARIPYPLFRHVRDPWTRTTPGVFLEPSHFHIEFEAVPVEVARELALKEKTADSREPAGSSSSDSSDR